MKAHIIRLNSANKVFFNFINHSEKIINILNILLA